MKKIQNIQALRGIAVMSVVFLHLLPIESKYGGGGEKLLPNIFEFGKFGVDLFFVISGFVMVTVTRNKFQMAGQAVRFMYNRISRIYPLYWIYSITVLGVFLIKPTWVNNSEGNQVEIISSFLLLPSAHLPLVMVGWTLIFEMYFYWVFFIILLLFAERHFQRAILIWGTGVGCINLIFNIDHPWFTVFFSPLTFEFIGGCLLAIMYHQKKHFGLNLPLLITMSAVSLLVSVIGYQYYQEVSGLTIPTMWWRTFIFGIPAILIVLSSIQAEHLNRCLPRSLMWIGDASYSIYLSHVLTLNVVGKVWSLFSSNSLNDNFLFIPLAVIAVLLVGRISYIVIEKPMLNMTRKWGVFFSFKSQLSQ